MFFSDCKACVCVKIGKDHNKIAILWNEMGRITYPEYN